MSKEMELIAKLKPTAAGMFLFPRGGRVWKFFNSFQSPDVGLIPEFLDPSDERDLRKQIDEAYAHGGGWHTSRIEWKIQIEKENVKLCWIGPHDEENEEYDLIALFESNGQIAMVFESAWMVIGGDSPTGIFEFEVARVD